MARLSPIARSLCAFCLTVKLTVNVARLPALTDEALQSVLHEIITRILKLLTRRGALVEEQGSTYMADHDADSDDARTLRPLQAAACTYRIAFGPRAGQKVLTLQGAMPRDAGFEQALCANLSGFSLHAAVRCAADDRQALEQLCRYITRPALANERVQCNAAGQVVLKLKTPWRDGTTHLVMSPLELMQRLAALVPRPALQAAPGQWPGPSLGTNSPLDCLCPGSACI